MLRIIIRNTGSNIYTFGIKLIITFIMTPVFVKNMGNYDYGIWEVIGSILGYMGMLDIGLRPTSSRFAAKYKATNDSESLSKVYSTSIFFMSMTSIVLALILFLWAWLNPDVLAQESSNPDKYAAVLVIIGTQLLFIFPGQIAESFLEGFQKYELKNYITIVNSIIGAALIYLLINPGNAIVLVAFINAAGLTIKYIIYIYLLTRKNMGGIRFRLTHANKKTFSELFTFGVKSFIQGAAGTVASSSKNVIIAYFLGPALVVFYSIPASLLRYTTTIRMLLTHTFMPLFSFMHAQERHEEIEKWFLHSSKLIVGLVLLVITGILLLGKVFIHLWIGPEYAIKGEFVLYILCLTGFITHLNPLESRYLTAVGMHGYLAKVNTIQAIFNISLSIIFAIKLGIAGVALGSFLPAIVRFFYVLRYTCVTMGIRVSRYYLECLLPLLIPVSGVLLTIAICKHNIDIDNYTKLLSVAFLGSVIYIFLFFTVSLKTSERIFLKDKTMLLLKRKKAG